MDELKADLIALLHKHTKESEVKKRLGISIGLIADGMIESISSSARIGHIAKKLPADFEIPSHLLDETGQQPKEHR